MKCVSVGQALLWPSVSRLEGVGVRVQLATLDGGDQRRVCTLNSQWQIASYRNAASLWSLASRCELPLP